MPTDKRKTIYLSRPGINTVGNDQWKWMPSGKLYRFDRFDGTFRYQYKTFETIEEVREYIKEARGEK